MNKVLYNIGMAAITTAVLVSCGGNATKEILDNQIEEPLPILGTWRYASMTCVMTGDKPDTVYTEFGPDTIQIYDVYHRDNILESYVTLGDSILRQTQMHYVFRNDSIIAENQEKNVQVQVVNATDSTLVFKFTLADGDKTVSCQTLSERCQLPDWLKRKSENKIR